MLGRISVHISIQSHFTDIIVDFNSSENTNRLLSEFWMEQEHNADEGDHQVPSYVLHVLFLDHIHYCPDSGYKK